MIPGFLLAGLYVVYVITRAVLNPKLAPPLPKEETNVPWGQGRPAAAARRSCRSPC